MTLLSFCADGRLGPLNVALRFLSEFCGDYYCIPESCNSVLDMLVEKYVLCSIYCSIGNCYSSVC